MIRTLSLVALLVASVAVSALGAPRIAVDLATYVFPDTPQGIAVAHTFVLSNVGDQDLVITDVRVSCECTRATLPTSRLAPGQSIGLEAIADTEGFMNHFAKTITLTSNDPGQWGDYKFSLYINGTVIARQAYQTSVHYAYDKAYVLLDVRDSAAFAAGHLVGAMNLPMAQLSSFAAALPPGAMTIVYDQNGTSASAAAQALQAGGLAAVYALRGGLDAWQRSFNVQRVVMGAAEAWSFLDASGARAYSGSATVQYWDVSQFQSDIVLIDIRPVSAFAAGHIAGALNVDESAISALVDTLPRATPVVVYSADGSDSDRVVYNLWMHGSRAKSLLGGLAEWQKQHGNDLIVSSAG